MALDPVGQALDTLRRSALIQEVATLTDGQLLERYVLRREAAAFEALLLRHGPMVLGVCRRVLRHEQDAEDAFQATFLVLARKAASVWPRQQVGPWLHGVAHNAALKARATAARRQAREKQVAHMPGASAPSMSPCDDWVPILDQELKGLPERYRSPLILCDLEGMTRQEAARHLGCPEGTVAGRLARARTLLAARLTRRGVTLSAAALAAMLSGPNARAAVPAALTAATAQFANDELLSGGVISARVADLTKGVLRAMILTRRNIVVLALLIVAGLGLGAGTLLYQAGAAPPPAKPGGDNPAPVVPVAGEERPLLGRTGHPYGTYLTIEGVRPDGGKGGQSSLMVDTVNGQKLKEPLGIPVTGVELPAGERCILNGYESGRFIGIPFEVLEAEKMGAPQAVWQFYRYFIVTSVKAPRGLAVAGNEP